MVNPVTVAPLTQPRVSRYVEATSAANNANDMPSQEESVAARPPSSTATSPTHSTICSRLRLLHASLDHGVWLRALQTQYIVLRNATGSIACAWLATACYALGNIFSGIPSTKQPRSELIVSNAVWCAITFSVALSASHLPLMLTLRFLESPNRSATVWFCLKKLARRSSVYFAVSTALLFALGSFVARLSAISEAFFKCKLDFYLADLCTHLYTTGLSLVIKHIYHQETIPRHDRNKPEQNTRNKPTPTSIAYQEHPVSPSISSRSHFTSLVRKIPPYYSPRSFWRAYVRGFPQALPVAFAGVYVHLLSQQRVVERSALFVTCFIVCSIFFKLAIQEGAKHYVIKKRVRSIRFMCVLVGLPTVLIDTQTRTILLRMQDTELAAMGTLGMAFIEICLRVGKAALVTWSIRRRESLMTNLAHAHHLPHLRDMPLASRACRASSTTRLSKLQQRKSPRIQDFELWCRQLMAFHTAELNADMYAEYISIGCSASILFFFGNHTHYSLLRVSTEVDSDTEGSSRRVRQLNMLVFQIGVEVVVDYVSIVLEMAAGIEFDHIKDLGAFLAALFIVTAVLNINISATIYLS